MMKCFGLSEKRRNYHCKIVLLDQTELIQEIQDVSRGQDVLDVVFKHLNLLETAYFGLRFINSKGQPFWLDPNKNVIKQMKDINPITLYLSVKFYASDPCRLLEEITRYQFFLQVKQDILQSRLPVTFDLAAELLAYYVQSELGDYDSKRHQNGYISEFKLLPNQTIEFENKAMELHQKLSGQVPATAEMNFLDRVKWLDLYGADLHPVLGEDNIEYFIGLTPSGVIVLRNKSKVGNYFWPRILKIIRNGKYFMLKVVDKNNEEKTYGFELPNKMACKQIWKCSKEHQNFFKLTQNTIQVNTKPGLKSRFRRSGSFTKTLPNDTYIERPPPTVVRVPSRRFQRRIGQPDGADAGSIEKDETFKENGYIEVKSSILMPSINRHNSTSALYKSNHMSRDTQSLVGNSLPYRNNSERGLFSSSANPSPRSVRSASYIHRSNGVKPFLDYNGNSYSDIRRNSSTNISKSRNSRLSDNESEVSKCSHSSRHSRHSRCRHRRQSEDSGTESDSSRKRRHKRKHKYCDQNSNSYKLVESESQWKDLQRKHQQINDQIDGNDSRPNFAQNAVVRHVSGYINSGLESDTETARHSTLNRTKKKQRSRSKSPEMNRKERIPNEMKKHFDYQLVDPLSMTETEKKDIKYTKIETESRLFKIRYSPSNGRHRYKLQTVPLENGMNSMISKPIDDNLNYMKSNQNYENSGYSSFNRMDVNHKSRDSNTSASSSQMSNSSKIGELDISAQLFGHSNDNYIDQNQSQTNTQNDYESYDMYRPTAQTRSASEFSAYSHFDNYYNEFNRNKKNQFHFESYPNDHKNDRIGDDLTPRLDSLSTTPRVTFQTHPTYYSTDLNKPNYGPETNKNKINPLANRTNFPLQSHEMSTEL